MHIKRVYYFLPEKEKGNDKNGRLRMRVTFDGKRFSYSVGFRVEFEKWNRASQNCAANTTHGDYKILASEINSEIANLTKMTDNIFMRFELEEQIPSLDEFKKRFHEANNERLGYDKNVVKKEKTVAFFNVFDEFVEEEGRQNNWTHSTYEKFDSVRNILYTFDEKLKFEDLNHARLNDYKDFLGKERDMRDSSVRKQLNFLNWFLNWAANKGYNTKKEYLSYKPKLKGSDTKIIFLTIEEIALLKNIKLPENKAYLDRVRDVFLFQCYTSLRYSDVSNLKRHNIKNDRIEVKTQKTFDSLTIFLDKGSKEILNKYKEYHFKDDLALPVISNQKMNVYLKELCKIAGFDDPIDRPYHKGGVRYSDVKPKYEWVGTHTGRRSFISNALASGMPPHIVMKFTGHSDYKSMEPYIDSTEQAQKEYIQRLYAARTEAEKNTNN